MKKRELQKIIAIFIFAVFSIFCIISVINISVNDALPENLSNDIAYINITLNDATLEDLNSSDKETKFFNNTLAITSFGHQQEIYSNVEVKGHGNSTWIQPKKPYQIKFDQNVDLFNLGKSKKYLLLANYLDGSHMRTDLAFYIENILEEDYALSGKFVELSINNDPLGLYYLTPKVEIGKDRINLTDPYGILVEYDAVHIQDNECSSYCLALKDSVDQKNEQAAMEKFISDFGVLEYAVEQENYSAIKNLIDTKSFAKYFLLSEFTANPDAYSISVYFYKNSLDDKIHIGPGWDFDLAFSNKRWDCANYEDFYLPTTKLPQFNHLLEVDHYSKINSKLLDEKSNLSVLKIYYHLLNIPEFQAEIKSIYQTTLYSKKDQFLNYLNSRLDLISKVSKKDSIFWDRYDDSDTKALLPWISERYDYMDNEYRAVNPDI